MAAATGAATVAEEPEEVGNRTERETCRDNTGCGCWCAGSLAGVTARADPAVDMPQGTGDKLVLRGEDAWPAPRGLTCSLFARAVSTGTLLNRAVLLPTDEQRCNCGRGGGGGAPGAAWAGKARVPTKGHEIERVSEGGTSLLTDLPWNCSAAV